MLYWKFLVAILAATSVCEAQADKQSSSPPKVFLDKSPRIVEYQLKRLSNSRLLQVERNTTDVKFAPVYKAILRRAGMSAAEREKAAGALSALNGSSVESELLDLLTDLASSSQQDQLLANQLTAQLLRSKSLSAKLDALMAAIGSENALAQRAGFAGLFSLGRSAEAIEAANTKAQLKAWLSAIELLPDSSTGDILWAPAMSLVAHDDHAIRRAAILGLKAIKSNKPRTYETLSKLLQDPAVRDAVVETLLTIQASARTPSTSAKVVDQLVAWAETTPTSDRTSLEFTNAMQLADRLLADLPIDIARNQRGRLRETTVRVVQIRTVLEEMRYDLPFFVVEAGRSVQVVLKNDDLMGHNLVIVTPESIQEVAEAGLAIGPKGDTLGRPYVPNSDKVLFATNMVSTGQEERITFVAPNEVGNYPYLCTFPRHWMRMYGVMVVVDDLDAWIQNPIPPADPLGVQREFVQNWKPADFATDALQQNLRSELAAASTKKGEALFAEATCSQCHQANGSGGQVGPSLNGVLKRWQGSQLSVLREILEPSHHVDPKYAVHLVVTQDGISMSGIVSAEDKESISLLSNPESKALTIVPKDEIEEMVKTATSMMPKGLLDRYSREEILDLLTYVTSLQ